MDFNIIKLAVKKQFKAMKGYPLFVANVRKDDLWDMYLKSFPAGSNPIYKERTEHDCNCCKSFIRTFGGVVAIVQNRMVTIWDINVGGDYQVVADALSAFVKSKKTGNAITNVFLHDLLSVGTDSNVATPSVPDGILTGSIVWRHFHCSLPSSVVVDNGRIGSIQSDCLSNYQVLARSLQDLTLDSAEVITDLISQNSLYRGEEHQGTVELFIKLKREFDKLSQDQQELFCWVSSKSLGNSSKIKNTVIGTLLSDISSGVGLDDAVRMFESKVAPSNYKRPTAIITPKMIKSAQEKVEELGLTSALQRRHAVAEDLTINNVLFADRSVKSAMSVFDEMSSETTVPGKKLGRVEEVAIDKFISDILPNATGVELLFENKHAGNLVSLIAPVNTDVKPIFKWSSNFSWAYAGEVADSIKERVKKAGGNVEGILRCSLSWRNYDDLDIHVVEPCGNLIYFSSTENHNTSGILDIDMNAGGKKSRSAVENITWTDQNKMKEGKYIVKVNNYQLRETKDVGFDVEIEYGGEIFSFHHTLPVKHQKTVMVAEFTYSKEHGIKILKSIPSTQAAKEAWGIKTGNFRKVSMIMYSPNHWDGEETGNKHWFFMLDGCRNGDPARGFFNEFLRNDLTEHRKVFEVLGSKMKAPVSDSQLSGLGFSSTQRNSVTCRVTGTFNRIIKINF